MVFTGSDIRFRYSCKFKCQVPTEMTSQCKTIFLISTKRVRSGESVPWSRSHLRYDRGKPWMESDHGTRTTEPWNGCPTAWINIIVITSTKCCHRGLARNLNLHVELEPDRVTRAKPNLKRRESQTSWVSHHKALVEEHVI